MSSRKGTLTKVLSNNHRESTQIAKKIFLLNRNCSISFRLNSWGRKRKKYSTIEKKLQRYFVQLPLSHVDFLNLHKKLSWSNGMTKRRSWRNGESERRERRIREWCNYFRYFRWFARGGGKDEGRQAIGRTLERYGSYHPVRQSSNLRAMPR